MKILIGCPTYERYSYCIDLWVERIKEIQKFSKDYQVDYLLVDNSKSEDFFKSLKKRGVQIIKAPYFPDVRKRVIYSRNIIRNKAMEGGYDYFFSLEQDVIPEKDILERLLNHNKKIISSYYGKHVRVILKDNETGELKKAVIEIALIWIKDGAGLRRANPEEVLGKGLMKVGGFGIGCVLISKDVFEKIKFRYEPDKKAFDDMFFCDDAERLGHDLFLDSDIKVKHLNKPWNRETV